MGRVLTSPIIRWLRGFLRFNDGSFRGLALESCLTGIHQLAAFDGKSGHFEHRISESMPPWASTVQSVTAASQAISCCIVNGLDNVDLSCGAEYRRPDVGPLQRPWITILSLEEPGPGP